MPNISVLGLDTSNYTTSAAFFCDGEMDSRGMILPVKGAKITAPQTAAKSPADKTPCFRTVSLMTCNT